MRLNSGGNQMKVAKFGGSSLADANQFRKVGNIIKEDPARKFIVVSAPGKRHEHDFKITDLLIQFWQAYLKNEKYKSYFITILDRFTKIIKELNISTDLITENEHKLSEILKSDLSDEDLLNSIKAVGEDSSAKILSAYLQKIGLKAKYVNPKDAGIIVTNDSNGAQILPESFETIYQLRNQTGILVIPGF